jgi:alkyl hydroperoxide reductase subunit F
MANALSFGNEKIVVSIGPTLAQRKAHPHLPHEELIDLIIVGAGPAGITAAIYAVRKKIKTLVLTKDIGGQAAVSGSIENYTGFQYITGPELSAKFEDHMNSFDLDIHVKEECRRVEKNGDNVVVVKTDRSSYTSKACIICTGATPKKLGIPGEAEFLGRGLSTCYLCDAPLFAGKDIAVIGGGNSALDAALQGSRFSSKVYLINKNAEFKGDPVLLEAALSPPNVETLLNAATLEVGGKMTVEYVKVQTKGETRLIPVQGVLVEVGYRPNTEMVSADKNDYGEIKVNCKNETSIPGIYAAGDATDTPAKQIVTAAGEGAKAVIWASDYLVRNF